MIEKMRKNRYLAIILEPGVMGKGRRAILTACLLSSVYTYLTGSVLYTAFLLANDIDMVGVGIVGMIPFLANIACLFSPMLLERFPRRKIILRVSSLISVTLSIACITLVPNMGLSANGKIVALVVFSFAASIIAALFSPGYTAWQLNYMENSIRAEFLSLQQVLQAIFGLGSFLLASIIAQNLRGTPMEYPILLILRWVGFALAVIVVLLNTSPKEFPYESAPNLKLTSIVTLPFKSRKFIATMAVAFAWQISVQLTTSSTDVYLLQNANVSYTLISLLNLFYVPILILLTPFARRVVVRFGWMSTFAIFALLHIPTWVMSACVTAENQAWMYSALRIIQHIVGVPMNLTVANFLLVNLPRGNQTVYLSFGTMVSNLGSFLGQALGTALIALIGDFTFTFGGILFTAAQQLYALKILMAVVICVVVLKNKALFTPGEENDKSLD